MGMTRTSRPTPLVAEGVLEDARSEVVFELAPPQSFDVFYRTPEGNPSPLVARSQAAERNCGCVLIADYRKSVSFQQYCDG